MTFVSSYSNAVSTAAASTSSLISVINIAVVKEKIPGCKKSEAAPYKINCASHVWPIQHHNVQADNSSTALLALLYPGGGRLSS